MMREIMIIAIYVISRIHTTKQSFMYKNNHMSRCEPFFSQDQRKVEGTILPPVDIPLLATPQDRALEKQVPLLSRHR